MGRYTDGVYEREENILHVRHPIPVHLASPETIDEFFRETRDDWISQCPEKPYLLVNFENVRLRADMTEAYIGAVRLYRPLVLATFRYGISPDAAGHFTAVAVRLGNMKISNPVNIFDSEAAAREAIRLAKQSAGR